MGINAQTSVPKFTSGDVLTAANTNLLTNAPPVFAGTATRDAAFGGTGEKTLAEGQLCYLEDSNIVQYYDGTVWATVGPATASALTFINSVSPSASATASISSCFTSTYAHYMITYSLTYSGNALGLMRLRIGSTDTTAANYNSALEYNILSSAGNGVQNVSASTSWQLNANGGTQRAEGVIHLFNPQTAVVTTGIWDATHSNGTDLTAAIQVNGGTFYNAATQFDGFTFLANSTHTLTGTIRVYGISNS